MINIKTDSRKVVKGDIFVALRGISSDGHEYILKAIENGASKIICEEGSYPVETIIVKDTKEYLINYLKDTYKEKLDTVKLIGITGTNGKTTSCYLTYQLLNIMNVKTAYIGTIGFYINGKMIRELPNTTPEIVDLYDMFIEAIDSGVKVIVMEVSSQAVAYKRVDEIKFDMACFTNLTQDHLDFHKTMDNYKSCKQELFKNLKNDKIAIINSDDPYYKDFLYDDNKNILFGSNGDYKILDYDLFIDHSNFTLENKGLTYKIKINLPCKYNIYNYMNCLIIINNLGYSIDEIIKNTEKLYAPNGRFDTVSFNNRVAVIDYAHTPDAVENIISNVNDYKKGKVVTIIGCGGDRDRTKRPIMGKLACEKSDYVIFTDDNPRTEDEKDIMNDIICDLNYDNYEVIYNRKEAIEKGIDILEENDILLILGKGHEDYQIIGKEKHHFSDKETVENYISKD